MNNANGANNVFNNLNFAPGAGNGGENNPGAALVNFGQLTKGLSKDLTPEQYAKYREALDKFRAIVDQGEVELQLAYERSLKEKVEAGRQAQQQLEVMMGSSGHAPLYQQPVQYAPLQNTGLIPAMVPQAAVHNQWQFVPNQSYFGNSQQQSYQTLSQSHYPVSNAQMRAPSASAPISHVQTRQIGGAAFHAPASSTSNIASTSQVPIQIQQTKYPSAAYAAARSSSSQAPVQPQANNFTSRTSLPSTNHVSVQPQAQLSSSTSFPAVSHSMSQAKPWQQAYPSAYLNQLQQHMNPNAQPPSQTLRPSQAPILPRYSNSAAGNSGTTFSNSSLAGALGNYTQPQNRSTQRDVQQHSSNLTQAPAQSQATQATTIRVAENMSPSKSTNINVHPFEFQRSKNSVEMNNQTATAQLTTQQSSIGKQTTQMSSNTTVASFPNTLESESRVPAAQISTPPKNTSNLPAPITPASAKKGRLADDILRALGHQPKKRKASRSPSTDRDIKQRPSHVLPSSEEASTSYLPITSANPFTSAGTSVAMPPAHDPNISSSVQPGRYGTLLFGGAASPQTAFITEIPTSPAPTATMTKQGIYAGNSKEEPQDTYISELPGTDVPSTPAIVEPIVMEDPPLPRQEEEPALSDQFEDIVDPLFLSSPEPSVSPELQPSSLSPSLEKIENLQTVPGPTPGLKVYVEIPLPPWHRKRKRPVSDPKGKGKEIVYEREIVRDPRGIGRKDVRDPKGKGKEREDDAPRRRFEKAFAEQAIPLDITETIELLHPKARPSEAQKLDFSDVSEERKKLAYETEIIAAKRLLASKCKWYGCPVVANSPWKLRQHVQQQHANHVPRAQEKVFACQWGNCARRFLNLAALGQHVGNHVRKEIMCPYKDCDEHFEHPLELLSHVEANHVVNNAELKPSAAFIKEPRKRALPPLGTMLAYRAVDIPVRTQPISREARAKLGPWVVKNMFGIVNFNVQKAKKKLRSGRVGDALAGVGEHPLAGAAPDKYDFLEPWAISYPPVCDYLDSYGATVELKMGLVLVPDRDGPRGPLGDLGLTALAHRAEKAVLKRHVVQPQEEEQEKEQEQEGEPGEERESEEPNEPVVKMEPGTSSAQPQQPVATPTNIDETSFPQDERFKTPSVPPVTTLADSDNIIQPAQAKSMSFSQSTALVPYDPRITELYKFLLTIRHMT